MKPYACFPGIHIKCWMQLHTSVTWALWRRQHEDPWSLGIRQLPCLSEIQVQRDPISKHKGGKWLRKTPLPATCACTCIHTHVNTQTHVSVNTHTHRRNNNAASVSLAGYGTVATGPECTASICSSLQGTFGIVPHAILFLCAILFTVLPYLVCWEPLNIVTCTQNNRS